MGRNNSLNVSGENRLLAILRCKEYDRLRPQLDPFTLRMKDVLYEANGEITHVYFPLNGVVSLVLPMDEGLTAEVCTVGNEGMVGTPVFLGAEKSPTRAITQVPGESLRMRAEAFRDEVEHGGPLRDVVQRYTQAMINQISQSVGCNNLHSVEERMCRWLLMSHDRVGTDEFPLTQEFLAQMLGVRRPSVSVVAGILQKAGLISYHRGRIKILDRKKLEAASCPCYRVIKQEFDRLLG
jgi:CRP-like cAMP-binding protein